MVAKEKKKSGKSAKAAKLPKTVAGIELPMELRKQGGKLLELARNPLVADLVAAGLVALAANVRNSGHSSSAAKTDEDGEKAKEKSTSSDVIGRTAVSLATIVAARAAEKITSKLTEPSKPAPAEPTAETPAPKPRATRAQPAEPVKKAATRSTPAKTAAKPKASASTAKPRAKAAAPLKAGPTRKPSTRKTPS
ncbi:MAG: hypothetical protein CVT77_05500 [Alphaproteobacteria bacterium HGW-Alphaproteobacteria-16]|nr:MAG: hypothetical protein CVT77_05500 [Alphaproteobacteria bacterium HGW-Alphaproteobacteria-16]